MTIIDEKLELQFLAIIVKTITTSQNRDDLFKLANELATACTAYTQTELLSNKNISSSSTVSKMEKVEKPELFGRPHREKVNLAEKLAVSEKKQETTGVPTVAISAELDEYLSQHDGEPLPITGNDPLSIESHTALTEILKQNAENRKCSKKENAERHAPKTDNSEKPNCPDRAALDPEQITPVWMSERVNLAEYWVYDYAKPLPIKHGNCGDRCWKTEIWLVHRHKHKLTVIDAEFVSLDALCDFLDPRKDLARENRIEPLEKIDAELAGTKEKQPAESRKRAKQSRFSKFLEYYHLCHGDPAKIASAMQITKQAVYSYKNKAKTMGIIL